MSIAPDYVLPVEIPGIRYFRDSTPFSLELGYTFANGYQQAANFVDLTKQNGNFPFVFFVVAIKQA